MKKYKLTDETRQLFDITLHRIVALRDFNDVKKGDKGGWIEKEDNLSQEGACWVYGNAQVCDNAKVMDNAEVWGNVIFCDNAIAGGNAKVCGNAVVMDNANVWSNAKVGCDAIVCDNAKVCDNAIVGGNAKVSGNAKVGGDAEISNKSDYIVFKNWWSSGRHFTWTRSNNMWSVGCFHGTGDELIKKAYIDSEDKGKHYAEIVKYVNKCVIKNEQETKK